MSVVSSWAQKAPFFKQVKVSGQASAAIERVRAEGLAGIPGRKAYELALAGKKEPHVLRLPEVVGCNVQISDVVTLTDAAGKPIAVLHVDDKWTAQPTLEAAARFGTHDESDPRVKELIEAGTIFFGGSVTFL